MLTREERAKAEDLFGRNPDATMKDVEQTLGRRPDGMVDALELDILRSRAKDEAKAAKAAGAKPEATKEPEEAKAAEAKDEAKPEEAKDGEPFARVRITVEMTARGKDDFVLSIKSAPAEVSDEEDRRLRVKAALLKLVANRACDEIGDRMDAAWICRATKRATDKLAEKLGMPKYA